MPRTTLPADAARTISDLIVRVERLERQTRDNSTGPSLEPPIVFTFPGELVDGIESARCYPDQNVTLWYVRVSLLSSASSDHVIDVNVNGSFVESYTLPNGDSTMTQSTSITLGVGDYLTVTTNTVTDNDLSVQFVQRAL